MMELFFYIYWRCFVATSNKTKKNSRYNKTMKTVNQIISHIVSKPLYSKISKKRCFMKVVKLLPPHLARAVVFTYTRNQTLFIALNHPGLKMEFHYKDNLIKSLLKQVKMVDESCHDMEEVRAIKYFVTHQKLEKDVEVPRLEYREKSSGNFSIMTKNRELFTLFERIKKQIKKTNG